MKIGIYTRVSKETSDNTNQLLVLREYCQRMNYQIVQEYVDVISGAADNKPQFSRMMQDASKRKFELLLFYALDRFTREGTRKTIQYLQLLDDYGVLYKSYTEQYIDSSGIFRDVIIALLSTLAMQERIRLSQRVKLGLEKTKKLNNRIGGRPKLYSGLIQKIKMLKTDGISVSEISRRLKVSRGSIYQYLKS